MVKKSFQVKVFTFNAQGKEHVLFCRDLDISPSVVLPYHQIDDVLHLLFGRECYVQFKSNYYGKED